MASRTLASAVSPYLWLKVMHTDCVAVQTTNGGCAFYDERPTYMSKLYDTSGTQGSYNKVAIKGTCRDAEEWFPGELIQLEYHGMFCHLGGSLVSKIVC